jgi:hypothetical protein
MFTSGVTLDCSARCDYTNDSGFNDAERSKPGGWATL